MIRANRRRGRPAPWDSMMFGWERAVTLVLPCGGIGFQIAGTWGRGSVTGWKSYGNRSRPFHGRPLRCVG